ncbi:hypothetical protein, partial [Neisseria lactamica]|uniref:hypothetical protein n=1 Tax=Neisseria lactamica TaxID=486 RepID=UPI0027E206F7
MPSEARRFANPPFSPFPQPFVIPTPPSFPRKWESSPSGFGHFRQIPAALGGWIPAFAGMTKSGGIG